MLLKNPKTGRTFNIMDPDCAICSQPATINCECEATGLVVALRQAEQKVMTQKFEEIRYVLQSCSSSFYLLPD